MDLSLQMYQVPHIRILYCSIQNLLVKLSYERYSKNTFEYK